MIHRYRVLRVIVRMGHRYGHETVVAVAPMCFDFHLIMFLGTVAVLAALFVFEMVKDGLV